MAKVPNSIVMLGAIGVSILCFAILFAIHAEVNYRREKRNRRG